MAYRIVRSEPGHETDESNRYETEEGAIHAVQQMIYAAETEGGAGGPPDEDHPHWWARIGGNVVHFRIVQE